MAEFNQVIKLETEIRALQKEIAELRTQDHPTAKIKADMKQRELDLKTKTLNNLTRGASTSLNTPKEKQHASKQTVKEEAVQLSDDIEKQVAERVQEVTEKLEAKYKAENEKQLQEQKAQIEKENEEQLERLESKLEYDNKIKQKIYEQEKTKELEEYFMKKFGPSGEKRESLSLGGMNRATRINQEELKSQIEASVREELMEGVEKKYMQELEELKEKYANEISQLELNYENKTKSFEEQKQNEVTELNKKIALFDEERRTYESEIQQLKDELEEKNKKVHAGGAGATVKDVEFKHAIMIEEQEMKHRKMIDDLNKEINALKQMLKEGSSLGNVESREEMQKIHAKEEQEQSELEQQEQEAISREQAEQEESTKILMLAKDKLERDGFDAARDLLYGAAERGIYDAIKLTIKELIKENKIFNVSKLYMMRKQAAAFADEEEYAAMATMEKTNPALRKFEERQIKDKNVVQTDFFSITLPKSYTAEHKKNLCEITTNTGILFTCEASNNEHAKLKMEDKFKKLIDFTLNTKNKIYVANYEFIGTYLLDYQNGKIVFTMFGQHNKYLIKAPIGQYEYNVAIMKELKLLATTLVETGRVYS